MSRPKIKHKHLAFSNQTYDQLLSIEKEFHLPMHNLQIAERNGNIGFDVWVQDYKSFKISHHKIYEPTRI